MPYLDNIPEKLYSWIREEDTFKVAKKYQIKYWWNAFSDLFDDHSLKKILGGLVEILSSEDCWKKVDNLHGIKLDGQAVGRKLLTLPFRILQKIKIACRCCLEEDMVILIAKCRKSMSFADLCNILAVNKKDRTSRKYSLYHFWLLLLDGHINSMEFQDSHPFEFGFRCAMFERQPQAMEFFWDKIKSLPEYEMKRYDKDYMLVKFTVYALKEHGKRPEMFEYIFSQIRPIIYSQLLKTDYKFHNDYRIISLLLDALRFDIFKKLFDCLKPHEVTENTYCSWLQRLVREDVSDQYIDVAVSALLHMCQKTGFHKHRSVVHNELTVNEKFQENLLLPIISKGYMDVLWAILDTADAQVLKKYLNSKNAKIIINILKEGNNECTLKRFLSYRSVSKMENCDTNMTVSNITKSN